MLKELIEMSGEIVIILNEQNRQKFLKQAESEGFKWFDGKEINPNDNCLFHILVKNDYTIGNISTMCHKNSNLDLITINYED